jgi:hypothetical protein
MKKSLLALATLASMTVGAWNSAQADALVVSVIIGTFTDGGPAWQTALNNAGVPSDIYYDPQDPVNGWPDLTPYEMVVIVYNDVWWDVSQGAFGPADEAVMAGYGGILVIIGQDYIWSTGGGAGPSTWLMSRFNITSVVEDVNFGDLDEMTLTGSVGGPFEGLTDTGLPCWVDNGWFTDDVSHTGIPTQDWVSPLGSGHGGVFVSDGLFSTNAYECFPNFQLWVDNIVDFFGLVGGGCPADVNNDGTVDVLDLLAVLADWGGSGVPADINGDGVVDVLDLLEVLAQWGPCP